MRESVIKGFEKYKIYEDGRVFHIRRNTQVKLQTISNGEHIGVSLRDNHGVVSTFRIQKLLAMCFIPNPDNRKYARSLDGDKNNYALDNIVWSNTSRGKILDNVPLMAYDKYDNTFIKEYNDIYEVVPDGFDVEGVRSCLKGRLKSHGGMRWIRKY